MATGIENYPNIEPADSDYPDGSIRDNPGDYTGTPFNRLVYDDIHQVFAKLLRLAGITASGLPENEYSGFQYIEALKQVARPYKSYVAKLSQSSTGAPTETVIENTIGSIVWQYDSTGAYTAVLSGAFGLGNTVVNITNGTNAGLLFARRSSANGVSIQSTNFSGTLANDIIDQASIEIRVYY